jgi:hypothetical protein
MLHYAKHELTIVHLLIPYLAIRSFVIGAETCVM